MHVANCRSRRGRLEDSHRFTAARSFARALGLAPILTLLAVVRLTAADPFLSWDFEDGSLGDLFVPQGVVFDVCDATLPLLPVGTATVDAGEVVITNDDQFGISLLVLDPEIVPDVFPAEPAYVVRTRVDFVTASQITLGLKTRIGVDAASGTVAAEFEHAYEVSLFPEGIQADFFDGMIGVAEFTSCHTLVDHPEWPAAADTGFARADPGTLVARDDWYWIEASVRGDETTGPVTIAVKVWLDGDAPPDAPQLIVTDPDGLALDPVALEPSNDPELLIGVSLDFPDGDIRDPTASLRIDDLSIRELSGCAEPPVAARRVLWDPEVLVEGRPVGAYTEGTAYPVSLELSEVRAAGACEATASVRVVETPPAGWDVSGISNGGKLEGDSIVWDLDLTGQPGATLSYTVEPLGDGLVLFRGQVKDAGSDVPFLVGGQETAASESVIGPFNDFAAIQHWLLLGPFTREVGGANPGEAEIVRDYLTDGDVTQADIQPSAGDTTEPDYGGAAASTALAVGAQVEARNPGGVPTWIEWRDLDDEDDRIDFEDAYGDLSDVMIHALAYLDVEDDVTVNFGVSSDDSVHILLDGLDLLVHDVARGALGRNYQDTPDLFPSLGNVLLTAGQHVLLVKVFEGGGENNFRVGFVDDIGLPLFQPPPGVSVSLEPAGVVEHFPRFQRGDANADGSLNITDGIFELNFLFLGKDAPPCPDAADSDDSGQINITDAIYTLNFLFLGGPPPPAPYPECGFDRSNDDALDCASFPNCP